MSPVELLAAAATAAATVTAAYRLTATWPLGIVATALYAVVFWHARLFADFALQGLFIAQCTWGWITWSRTARAERPPRGAPGSVVLATALSLLLLVPVIVLVLRQVPTARHIVADAMLTAGSIVATVLLIRSYALSWIIWTAVNVGYVVLGIATGLHATAVLYAGLACWSSWAWWRWKEGINR